MQTLESSLKLTHIYRPSYRTPEVPQEPVTDSLIVHLATSVSLRDELATCFRDLNTMMTVVSDLYEIARRAPARVTCGVIDLDLFGLESCSLGSLLAGEHKLPLILIGTCSDARLPVRAIKAGAVDFFPKPIDIGALSTAITLALEHDRRLAVRRAEEQELRSRMALLTPREREVLPLVVGGLLNKQAAALLGISEITLQIHRGQVMRKMQASSLPDLVRMCMKLRVRHWRPTA